MSASLAGLRRHFGDDLLVRAGNEYRLTPLAARLRDRVHLAVAEVERVFLQRAAFDPATSTREFRLLVDDYALALFPSRPSSPTTCSSCRTASSPTCATRTNGAAWSARATRPSARN
jgi:hypothetical protein